MAEGTIRSIRDDRGFGCIRPDGEAQNLFFHASTVQGITFERLREGQRIAFAAGTDPRSGRTRAEAVRAIDER